MLFPMSPPDVGKAECNAGREQPAEWIGLHDGGDGGDEACYGHQFGLLHFFLSGLLWVNSTGWR